MRHANGTLYFLYASGDAGSTGFYQLRAGSTPQRIAGLPATGLPNGLALDERTGTFHVTDSVLGTISTVPLEVAARQCGRRLLNWLWPVSSA